MKTMSQKDFYDSTEQFISNYMKLFPVSATHLGIHSYDHLLGDFSTTAINQQAKFVKAAISDLEQIDSSAFGIDAQIDHALLIRICQTMLYEYDDFREHLRNPNFYSQECMNGVFLLLVKDFAPLEQRLENVLRRTQTIPEVLSHGKSNLIPEEVPAIWNKIAIDSCRQGVALFAVLVPSLAASVPHINNELNAACQSAATAINDYADFLESRIAPVARGDFAAGEKMFEALLSQKHMLDCTADELLRTGWSLFDETRDAMEEIARTISSVKTARELLEESKALHPEAGELLDVYRREMARARQFVIDNDIASIPEGEELKVEPTPPFMRGIIPYAAYIMPGPFEQVQQGIFLVTPVDPQSPPEEMVQKLKGHNFAKLPVTALHEAYPGHHLQLTFANQAGSKPRKLGSFISTLFIEGWAFYCEELMEQLGYIDQPLQRLGRLADQLWRAARIILDVSLHTGKITIEQGIEFLVEKAGLERSNAQAEIYRYTMSPAQPMSYLIGKMEILKLVDEYKQRYPEVPLITMHDAILSCGSLPPKLMRKQLFNTGG